MGRIGHLVDLGVLFVYFGAFSLGTFAYRLWSYGHHLDPHAPMRVAPFTPVVIGSQQIANFVQTSLPMAGTVCMGLFLVAILCAAIWFVAEGGAVTIDHARLLVLSGRRCRRALPRCGRRTGPRWRCRAAGADCGVRRRRDDPTSPPAATPARS